MSAFSAILRRPSRALAAVDLIGVEAQDSAQHVPEHQDFGDHEQLRDLVTVEDLLRIRISRLFSPRGSRPECDS